MKRLVMLISALVLSAGSYAQIETPQPSTAQKIEQKVGLTDVTLDYSRPSKRGRTIYGDLIPFDVIWRTGANANTKISFSTDVEMGGTTVKAGTYAIYSKPNPSSWDIYLYSDSNNWGAPEKWDASKVVAQVNVPSQPMTHSTETFTLTFDNINIDSAVLGIHWDKTYVAVPLKFNTDMAVTANIEKVMSGPSANDYYAAAVYYLEAGKDIKQAKMWIDKSLEGSQTPAFWQVRQKALIYAKAGDKKGAIEAAKQSMTLAKQAGNKDYVALNEKSLKEWGAM